MRGFYLYLCLFFYSSFVLGQKESSNWYFGKKAGIGFSEIEARALSNGKLDTNEGCATISNNNGELLFYTDGITVWDSNHEVMLNGFGLLGNPSSTQSAIIVPRPSSNSIYYIFTITNEGGIDGFRYSEVDLSMNNGLGAITGTKNKLLATPCVEKITALQHGNGLDFWVIAHGWNNAEFLAYQVTDSGIIETPIKSTIGSIHTGAANNSIGYMKASPNGKKLALAKWNINSLIEIFDFDNHTGIVSNPITIDNFFDENAGSGAYGLEFSRNSKMLYVTDVNLNTSSSKLHQFDLSNPNRDDIIDSSEIIYSGSNILSALQLAIDGKIYISNTVSSYLDVIENPNNQGFLCNYKSRSLNLDSRITIFGLPPFIQSLFVAKINVDDVCLGEINKFTIETDESIDSVLWDFGDGYTSNEYEPLHIYENSGIYDVSAKINSGSNIYNVSTQLEVFENPIIDMSSEWVICDNEPISVFLNSTHDLYLWSSGSTASEILIEQPGIYSITVIDFNSDNTIMCESSIEFVVTKSSIPTTIEVETIDWTQNNNSIIIHANELGNYEYSLDNNYYQDDNKFNNLPSGEYTVYVKDKLGCGLIQKDVYLLNYPKYFTPNDDGYHDTWNIPFSETEPNMVIHIFDRYGKLLKMLTSSSVGWDGTYNGNEMPTSDYWFTINRPSINMIYKGHFTLKR